MGVGDTPVLGSSSVLPESLAKSPISWWEGRGERKRVAELVVLMHVFYCGCCCSSYNVPITTHLDSLIKMLKFFFWLCSDIWAEDQGPWVLPLALGSLRLKIPQGVRAPWLWDR